MIRNIFVILVVLSLHLNVMAYAVGATIGTFEPSLRMSNSDVTIALGYTSRGSRLYEGPMRKEIKVNKEVFRAAQVKAAAIEMDPALAKDAIVQAAVNEIVQKASEQGIDVSENQVLSFLQTVRVEFE